jgi:hypothetical protein
MWFVSVLLTVILAMSRTGAFNNQLSNEPTDETQQRLPSQVPQ